MVVASPGYLQPVTELAIVMPATTQRGWPQHVELTGVALALSRPTFAMAEQPRTLSRARIVDSAGTIDGQCLALIRRWLNDFLYDD